MSNSVAPNNEAASGKGDRSADHFLADGANPGSTPAGAPGCAGTDRGRDSSLEPLRDGGRSSAD
jgi:hypothetical protein